MLEDLLSLLGGHWTRMALCVLGQATHEAAALWAGGAAFLEGVAEPGAGGNATRKVPEVRPAKTSRNKAAGA